MKLEFPPRSCSKYTQISISRKILPVELRCSMLSERYNEVTIAFVILQTDPKIILTFLISFYIQQAVGPAGAKRVAYRNTTKEFS